MPCTPTTFPGGARGFVCSSRPRRQRCACGQLSTKLCDWKVLSKKTGTCDRPLCAGCTHIPAPDKDLCPDHAAEWLARPRAT